MALTGVCLGFILLAMRRTTLALFLAFFISTASDALQAQQGATARVAVVVTDVEGAVVARASVRFAPGAKGVGETDELGQTTTELNPGSFNLSVEGTGFKHYSRVVQVISTTKEQIFPVVLDLAPLDGTRVTGVVDTGTLTLLFHSHSVAMRSADLSAMPHITVTVHNPQTNADETYSGVRVADLLTKVDAPLGKDLRGEAMADYVIATGSDGYKAVLALGEVDPSFHPGEVIVADAMDGKPLDAHNGPLKLVVSEDKRPARCVRNLTTIELKSAP